MTFRVDKAMRAPSLMALDGMNRLGEEEPF